MERKEEKKTRRNRNIIVNIKQLFSNRLYLSEQLVLILSLICGQSP